MILENIKVKHTAFGEGTVVSHIGSYITVRFESVEKKFVYPAVFERFLTLADGTVSDEIRADIDSTKKEKQLIIDKKNEENLRAMTRGIVIPGKEATASEGDEDEPSRSKETEEI